MENSKTNGWRKINRIEDTILYNFVGTVIKIKKELLRNAH
jgi:hypothetical protein